MLGGTGKFLSRNVVMVVMIPFMFAAHYGWLKLQSVDTLVSPEDINKLPAPIGKILKTD